MANSTFGFDKPQDSPGFLLWQTSVTWQRLIKSTLDSYGLSHPQFVIMALLLWSEKTNFESIQSFIVNKSKLDKMTVSASLKKLGPAGLVERNEYAHDTRAKLVCLTKKGRILTRKLVPIVEAIDRDFFGTIKKTDQQSLIGILNHLVSNVEA